MNKFEVISAKVDECPHYFDFTKNDFVENCPGMAKLNYDPFPANNPSDVVRREIIARKLVLRARIRGEVFDIRPGVAISHNGQTFAITQSIMEFTDENPTADIEGEAFLTKPEPLKVLSKLRDAFATK